MARKARVLVPNCPHHIVQRGHNRKAVFLADEDYQYYLGNLKEYPLSIDDRTYLYSVIQDVTEYKQCKIALETSEKRFIDFSEWASDWFWEMGPDLRFTYFSDRFSDVTGIRPEEIIGTKRTGIMGSGL